MKAIVSGNRKEEDSPEAISQEYKNMSNDKCGEVILILTETHKKQWR